MEIIDVVGIDVMVQCYCVNFINSLLGYKSVNLIGICNEQ